MITKNLLKQVFVFAASLFFLVACGGGESAGDGADSSSESTEEGADGEADAAGCNTAITEASSDKYEMEGFEVKKTVAYKAGASASKGQARTLVVCLANYEDVKIGKWNIEYPETDSGNKILMITFKGAFVPKEEKLAELEVGEFQPGDGFQDGAEFYATYIRGKSGYNFTRADDSTTGTAKITEITDDKVCGEITVTGKENTKLTATFTAPIEKDTWADQMN